MFIKDFILKRRLVIRMFSLVVFIAAISMACAQDYPNKPIRIVTSEAGGGNDYVARLISPEISNLLGQPVIVDNRHSNTVGEIVSKAAADGYTLLVYGGTFWLAPLLQKTPYDPIRDFSPISLIEMSPSVLVVNPALQVNNVEDVIALAKGNPGRPNYASSVTGSSPHLAAELFKAMAGINIFRVNYKGNGPALASLMSGEVQLMFVTPASAMPLVKSGRLRALAVTSAKSSPLVPGIPAVAASGLPGYEVTRVTEMLAPAKLPIPIIVTLNQVVVQVLNKPEVKEKFFNSGSEVIPGSPEKLAAMMKADMAKFGKVIKDAGISAE